MPSHNPQPASQRFLATPLSSIGAGTRATKAPAADPAPLYRTAQDRDVHQAAMVALAAAHHVPLDMVQPLYESHLLSLRCDATVTAFLPMLLEKHVRTGCGNTGKLASPAAVSACTPNK
jgi:hypothetical protein